MSLIELRERFRAFRQGGYTWPRVGKANTGPIKVKTFQKPAPAAQFAAAALGRPGMTVEAVLQGQDGNQEVTVYDGKEWTRIGRDLLRALASEDECALADLIGKRNEEDLE